MARMTAFLLWVALPLFAYAETLSDGPYVLQDADGRWMAYQVTGDDASSSVKHEPVAIGDDVTVAAVENVPAFRARLRPSDPIAPDEIAVSARTPLFVVADTHGQFAIFVALLQKHAIVDSKLRWSFGKGHLAVLGDVFDRGPNHTEIFWLLYKLEAEAAQAGGGVHFVLGNHETLALLGDRGYLHPKYLRVTSALNVPVYADLWGSNTLLGRWLRTKASVMKLGDFLCLHGGISKALVDRSLSLAQINQSIRDALTFTEAYKGASARPALNQVRLLSLSTRATDADRELAGFLMSGPLGPLWYRGYFPQGAQQQGAPIALDTDIDSILSLYDVRKILVGHTIVDTITLLYNGRVIAVQVAMRYESPGQAIAEGLAIKGGKLYRARLNGKLEELQMR
jgi:Calcineurin-like phosphoesterase